MVFFNPETFLPWFGLESMSIVSALLVGIIYEGASAVRSSVSSDEEGEASKKPYLLLLMEEYQWVQKFEPIGTLPSVAVAGLSLWSERGGNILGKPG